MFPRVIIMLMQTITIPKTTYQELKQKAALYDRTFHVGGEESDEAIWEEIKPIAQRVRENLFQKYYPGLYAKNKKKPDLR